MKYATGNRFKQIADKLFDGNLSELARNLEMKPQALTKYVKGESMPGGLILIRLYDLGVNINWFLTGEGEMLLESEASFVSEPIEEYLGKLEREMVNTEDREAFNDLLQFSDAISGLDISPSLQRALLLVYSRHVGKEQER